MKSTQVTTWRRYTTAQKKAYRARQERKRLVRLIEQSTGLTSAEWDVAVRRHYYADNFGSRVPTARVNGDVL